MDRGRPEIRVAASTQSATTNLEGVVNIAHSLSKKNFCIALPQIDSAIDDHQRDATIVKGLPRLRAFARTDVTERFSETAMLAGDEPSSISAIKRAVWAGVHFLLPMRTIRPNPACQPSFRDEINYGTSEP